MNYHNFKKSILALLAILFVVSIFFSVRYAWISADAPYYISVGRDISEGKILFKDVIDHYTPFVSVLYSYVYVLYDQPPFTAFMVLHLFVIVLSGGVFFFLLRTVKLDSINASILAVAFCLAIFSSDGNYIILESYGLFFVLVALFSFLKDKNYFLAGMLLGGSFLCKQYGVLNFVPFFFGILLRSEPIALRLKKSILLGLGGLLIFISFIGYYAFKGVDPVGLLEQISGARYTQWSVEKERSIAAVLIGAKVFLLFLSIPLVYIMQHKKISAGLKFCGVGILVSLLPIFLQPFQHYYINAFPYLFLAIGLLIETQQQKVTERRYIIMLFIATIICSGLLLSRMWRYSSRKKEQSEIADRIAEHISKESPVFIHGQYRYLYVLNNYKNPFVNTIGYDYSFNAVDSLVRLGNATILTGKRLPEAATMATEIKIKGKSIFIYQPRKR